jgi:hypothetical protein
LQAAELGELNCLPSLFGEYACKLPSSASPRFSSASLISDDLISDDHIIDGMIAGIVTLLLSHEAGGRCPG